MSLRQLSSPKVTMLLTEGSLDSGRFDCSNRHPEARHLGPRRLDAGVSAAHLVLNHPDTYVCGWCELDRNFD
jgi:hypothetical protein